MPFLFFLWHEHLSNRLISECYCKNDAKLHELKQVQLQEHFMLTTPDSIGHLKTLCMKVLSAEHGGIESE